MWTFIGYKSFVAEKLIFMCRKMDEMFCQIFGTRKLIFLQAINFCKSFVRLKTLARFHAADGLQGGAVTFQIISAASTNPELNLFCANSDHLSRLFFSTPTFFFRIFRDFFEFSTRSINHVSIRENRFSVTKPYRKRTYAFF